ncbi:Mitochondrial distribution and morphology protein 31, mitochondrial precursor [Microsporum canis]|uniref:Mitochondrial distribution and morphology protein 31 n=1 Tax=Arthroderma otae (strain ATCC MYA-4605 / CBS 113480) TaxID=554155 RepID=C5FY53_ARTOC|nr:mitochondrial distribution and morphology protein 31 [Microsporum canis CBS 113480]EEQ34451.1 mitochondrial distribution and morphology protein 31 [Microsporum canis CBS 113480]
MSGHIGRRLLSTLRTGISFQSNFIQPSRQGALGAFTESCHGPTSSFNLFRNRTIRRFSYSKPKNVRKISRQFASGGLLVVGTTSTRSAATVETGAAACVVASAEKSVYHGSRRFGNALGLQSAASWGWRRCLHTSKGGEVGGEKDHAVESSRQQPSQPSSVQGDAVKPEPGSVPPSGPPKTDGGHGRYHLMDRLPHMHRPTKEELLAAATGFWSRLKVRFKWFSIRSARPFNVDEIGTFFSWVLLGHVLWVILGTTTFFSLIIFTINTVFAQETLARWIGNYLTRSSGVKVVFESAIVPKWGDGVITFKNVFVSRRPGQGKGNVSKGSSKTAAAAAFQEMDHMRQQNDDETEDSNYTQFDVSIDTVNVTLSFTKWFNSHGLLKDVHVKGIRGIVDRTHVKWTEADAQIDPKSYRVEHNPGDFELDSFKMEDVLVTIYQPNNFRPFTLSIFSCDLPRLRRQWLFYDFMSANIMSGSYDNSLFTIHPRQTHRYTGAQLQDGLEEDGSPSPWKKHNRIRIDGLNIDHLNTGVEGPFSWIHEGTVDIVADLMLPAETDESLGKVMSDFYDRMEATVTSDRYQPNDSTLAHSKDDKRFVVTDLRIHLNNVRAVVPIFNRDLSYVNNALIRPIVAYINSRRTFIPIQCRLVKRASDFDGSWTIFDSGLMDDLSAETYDAFARDVVDEQARTRRFKKVGLWSLQLAAQAIFMGMAGNII